MWYPFNFHLISSTILLLGKKNPTFIPSSLSEKLPFNFHVISVPTWFSISLHLLKNTTQHSHIYRTADPQKPKFPSSASAPAFYSNLICSCIPILTWSMNMNLSFRTNFHFVFSSFSFRFPFHWIYHVTSTYTYPRRSSSTLIADRQTSTLSFGTGEASLL